MKSVNLIFLYNKYRNDLHNKQSVLETTQFANDICLPYTAQQFTNESQYCDICMLNIMDKLWAVLQVIIFCYYLNVALGEGNQTPALPLTWYPPLISEWLSYNMLPVHLGNPVPQVSLIQSLIMFGWHVYLGCISYLLFSCFLSSLLHSLQFVTTVCKCSY